METLLIKPMQTEEEIAGKAYVHFKSWHETYAGLIDDAYLSGFTEERCRLIAQKWRDNLLVAKDGDKVVGFVGYGRCRDESLSECGEIFSIYVLADYQGKKIGYALMNAAMKQLQNDQRIVLWVLKGNEKAIRFYQKYGFRFDGVEKHVTLGTPNTELRMVYEGFKPRVEVEQL